MKHALILGMLFPVNALCQSASPAPRTVWDGVYNQAQQERGAAAYATLCSQCHGEDLGGYRGALRSRFMERWREDKLSSLFTIMQTTMPPGPRGRVSSSQYVDIIAFVLGQNQFPSGAGELMLDDLERIQIVSKDGPKAVPDFSLVTVVGCLAPRENGKWVLTQASEPARTRNPRESTEAELTAAKVRVAGSHTFGLLDTLNFQREVRAGRWMEAKGFLMRSPGNDRINLTWLRTLRDTCEPSGAQ